MVHLFFAAEEAAHGAAEASPLAALGVDGKTLVFQLITFLLAFLVLKKFAFGPITKMLRERRKTIDDGVRMGLRMEQEKAKLDEEVAKTMREARHEADQIIAAAHKESREIVREAEKNAQKKSDAMLADMDVRLAEEAARARRSLEKDLVNLVSEATETIVGEKVDAKRDVELVKRAMKEQRK